MARSYDTDQPYDVGLYDWTQGTITAATPPASSITTATRTTATITGG